MKAEKDRCAVELGRKGGLVGGYARAAKLSPERRSEIAKRAAAARWGDVRFFIPQRINNLSERKKRLLIEIKEIEAGIEVLTEAVELIEKEKNKSLKGVDIT